MGRSRTNEVVDGGMNDLPYNSINPFLDKVKMEYHFKNGNKYTDLKTEKDIHMMDGEVIGLAAKKEFEFDDQVFIKLFREGLMEWFELSENACKVLGYIMSKCLKKDSDTFLFDYKMASADMDRKVGNWIFKSIFELCRKNIIARGSMKGSYYINPHFLFNGNRIQFIKTFIRKQSKTK